MEVLPASELERQFKIKQINKSNTPFNLNNPFVVFTAFRYTRNSQQPFVDADVTVILYSII